jgi:hypothetical protein
MHEKKDAEMRAILERIKGYYGFVPRIYQELQRNPTALKAFFYKNEQLATEKALPGLTKELIRSGLQQPSDLNTVWIPTLKERSASEQLRGQIFLAILLGASVAESTTLSKSLRAWKR